MSVKDCTVYHALTIIVLSRLGSRIVAPSQLILVVVWCLLGHTFVMCQVWRRQLRMGATETAKMTISNYFFLLKALLRLTDLLPAVIDDAESFMM